MKVMSRLLQVEESQGVGWSWRSVKARIFARMKRCFRVMVWPALDCWLWLGRSSSRVTVRDWCSRSLYLLFG